MESNLGRKVSDIEGEIGVYAGWGRDPDGWDDEQKDIIKSCVGSGLRSFYFPPSIAQGEPPHNWSFLRPYVTMTLASGETTIDLPDDFGGFEGQLLLSAASNVELTAIDLKNEGYVRRLLAEQPDWTGPPLTAALVAVKGTSLTKGQRFQLLFFPTADAAYSIQFAYYLLPSATDGSHPYAYGGAQHYETILEACKAAYEAQQDDNLGIHKALFMERLGASIAQDRRNHPQKLPPNLDRSDEMYGLRQQRWHGWPVTTFNGDTPA